MTRASVPWSRRAPLALVAALAAGGCDTVRGTLFGDGQHDPAEITVPPAAPVPYQVRYTGDLERGLRTDIETVSVLIARIDRPPASVAALERRVRDDLDRVEQVLRSRGYYDARLTPAIDTEADPAQVVIDVAPGPLFRLDRYQIRYLDPPPGEGAPLAAEDVGLALGAPAMAEPLIAAERRIVRRLQEHGHPAAEIAARRYVADRARTTLSGEITVNAGPAARFGPLRVFGLDRVEPAYIDRVVGWRPDQPYDIRRMERARSTLVGTGLFDSVALERGEDTETPGVVPVRVDVVERPPRSIGLGVTYSTDDEGFGGEGAWEHRNLFGRAERLSLTARGTEIRQEVVGQFRQPNVLRRNQAIVANTNATRETSDAYDGLFVGGFVGVERSFRNTWTVTLGPAGEISRIEENGGVDRFALLGLNSAIVYDRRNDRLDPTTGMVGTVSLAPYTSVAASKTRFAVADGSLAGYLPAIGDDRLVLAARGRLGSVIASERSEVPANHRLYAGGGGSVRGYAFRSIGPLDEDDDPIGGRSAIEVNGEARIRVTESIGIVTFVDGGQVYGEMIPWFEGNLRWAAGTGLRYRSPVGPFRLDVAFPINRRPVDDVFQLYFSIGQAF